MFQKIAKVNIKDGWAVEIGYDVPNVITNNTELDLTSRIVNDDPNYNIDTESEEYKQMQSVEEVLKVGFQIGCSYTMKVMEQVATTGTNLTGNAESGLNISDTAANTNTSIITE